MTEEYKEKEWSRTIIHVNILGVRVAFFEIATYKMIPTPAKRSTAKKETKDVTASNNL